MYAEINFYFSNPICALDFSLKFTLFLRSVWMTAISLDVFEELLLCVAFLLLYLSDSAPQLQRKKKKSTSKKIQPHTTACAPVKEGEYMIRRKSDECISGSQHRSPCQKAVAL